MSKYEIGDRIEGSNFEVVGKMINSKGVVTYWLRIFGKTIVVEEEYLEMIVNAANGCR